MATVLLVSPSRAADPLPELTLLPYSLVRVKPTDPILTASAAAALVVIDARIDLPAAKAVCRLYSTAGVGVPRLVVLAEGGLPAYSADWDCDDFVVDGAGPAEYDARLRVLTAPADGKPNLVTVAGLTIDPAGYSAALDGEPLDLTYTEFELLKYLAGHPGRVFSREHLLTEVWGYDYYGGTRTVDVHVRRLRAKLGPEHDALISTVRNVGYRFAAR